ncbi:MAG: tyrosine-protein phosphatase [Paraburkholderia sp.]|uniref:tyrosine-protein phosphatase n=1 Tax=Paraburkholderia sp. TaxID=1926495 RepID=UPI0012047A8F|nr:tyrosine-protein phosphatase [Paraburkholderia sp.]TAM00563.1 MAG: tyrosine-protein phosphatase [Paraburkholderia sp.]TAM30917.1 MAG: tyrosine-protein phosphatase [Paraburkholderia sp.]
MQSATCSIAAFFFGGLAMRHCRYETQHALHSPERRRLMQRTVQGAFGGLILPVAGSALLTACGGNDSTATTMPTGPAPVAPTPILASVNNFRDVAGADDHMAYRTASGQKLRRGVFYRSNALALSAADLTTINTLGIKVVYDLRTGTEVTQVPDTVPAGAKYVNVDVLGSGNVVLPTLQSPADAAAFMEKIERQFVTDAGIRARIGEVLTGMANGANAQLFHCTAGKDRAGWIAAILLTLADVPQSVVIQDYLLTNIYSAASIESQYNAMITGYGQSYADNFYPLLGVQTRFLLAGFNQAVTSYGSMSGYITEGLNLSSSTQNLLKSKLLG